MSAVEIGLSILVGVLYAMVVAARWEIAALKERVMKDERVILWLGQ